MIDYNKVNITTKGWFFYKHILYNFFNFFYYCLYISFKLKENCVHNLKVQEFKKYVAIQ